jgi:hypothetical protein
MGIYGKLDENAFELLGSDDKGFVSAATIKNYKTEFENVRQGYNRRTNLLRILTVASVVGAGALIFILYRASQINKALNTYEFAYSHGIPPAYVEAYKKQQAAGQAQ